MLVHITFISVLLAIGTKFARHFGLLVFLSKKQYMQLRVIRPLVVRISHTVKAIKSQKTFKKGEPQSDKFRTRAQK